MIHRQAHSRSLARLTVLSLAGLTVGLAAGLAIQRTSPGWATPALGAAEVLIRAWTNAFRMLVAPLVFAHLFVAVTGGRPDRGHLGRVGAVTPLVFGGLLAIVALLSWLMVSGLMRLPWLAGLTLPTPDGTVAAGTSGPGDASWVDGFVPPNLVAAAGTDNILPLMLFALAFALAARRLPADSLGSLRRGLRAVGDAMFVLVEWLLVVTPLVILALALRSGASSGLLVGGALLGFTGVEIVTLIVATAALYPIVTLIGGVGPGRFARAVYPAQLAAAATRSSLAALPALLDGAERLRPSPRSSASYVLPLAGATLKLSRAVSGPVKLLFLATILGVPLTLERIAVFIITIILLSPSTVGVPRVTSGSRSLPAYIAAGIPGEYVVLLGATTMLADVFMTVLNATGYLGASVLVDRFAPAVARPDAEPHGGPDSSLTSPSPEPQPDPALAR